MIRQVKTLIENGQYLDVCDYLLRGAAVGPLQNVS